MTCVVGLRFRGEPGFGAVPLGFGFERRLAAASERGARRLAPGLDRRSLGGDGGTTSVERRDLFAIEDDLLLLAAEVK